MKPNTDAAQLEPLINAGYKLIPLHNHAAEDQLGGKSRKRGKSPLHRNWTKRPYKPTEQIDHMEAGDNVGVRLKATDLVVDVDPRNFQQVWQAVDPFVELVLRTGLDPDEFPTVVTGSGGLHIYMVKDAETAVVDSLADFPGVEFKSIGRQVVAPGSIHPDTLRTYAWRDGDAEKDLGWLGAPKVPEAFLEKVKRKTGAATASMGGGEHDPGELADMLSHLDPESFQDHDSWLGLMQACHHATAGCGRQEFIDWSTGDLAYADQGAQIGARWDSLSADNSGSRVTYRTLHKIMRDHGAGEEVPRPSAEDDFDNVDEDEIAALVERERREDRAIGETSLRERLSVRRIDLKSAKRDLVYVSLAGGVVDLKSGRAWRTVELAATHFAGSRMILEPEKTKDEGDAPKRGRPAQPKEMRVVNVWVGDKGGSRKTVDVMTWAPGRGTICPPPEGRGEAVNVWGNLQFGDAPADWAERAGKFEDHVRWLLPNGDDADDFLDWVAHIVQEPGVLPHTAWLMITSKRGVGRNWVASVLARVLAGHAALGVDLGDVLGSSFNERLSEKLLLVVDETREGSGADRYRKANKLQKVITEEHREINPKFGLKSVQYNCCRFLMFSNFMDALPIDDRDRRIRVAYNPEQVRDPSYYSDLYQTRRDPKFIASVARLLQERDLTAFNPGLPAPMTDAKRSVVEFMETEEHRELKALFRDWPADLIGLSDVREHLDKTCNAYPSNLKFLVDEAGGVVTQRRFNQPGSGGNEKDYVVIARRGKWDALRVKREKPAEMKQIILAARKSWTGGTT